MRRHAPAPRSPRRAPAARLAPVALGAALVLAGCASSGRLGEYDFVGSTVAVSTVPAPRPYVDTGEPGGDGGGGWLGTIARAGGEMAEEHQGDRLLARLDSAAEAVDVAALMADRAVTVVARELRATAVENPREADFELDVRVLAYGVRTDDSQGAAFDVEADMRLLEAASGRLVWKTEARCDEPIRTDVGGFSPGGAVGDVVTARALSRITVAEIERTLAELAEVCADAMGQTLRERLEEARR